MNLGAQLTAMPAHSLSASASVFVCVGGLRSLRPASGEGPLMNLRLLTGLQVPTNDFS